MDDLGTGNTFISNVAVARWDSTQAPRAAIVDNHLETDGSPSFVLIGALNGDNYDPQKLLTELPVELRDKGYSAFLGALYWGYGDKSGAGSYYGMSHFRDFYDSLYRQGTLWTAN